MKTQEIAPGSILQRIYLKKRINKIIKNSKYRNFIEIGSGTGYLSNILLNKGYTGVGYDLNSASCDVNNQINSTFIGQNKYNVRNEDFLACKNEYGKVDLIISCMVIEHLNEEDTFKYFNKCRELLTDEGVLISLVPSSMKYWGIEDEIAGHFKRYSFNCFKIIAKEHNYRIVDCCGLTFPLSNVIFPFSNFLIKRAESKKLNMTKQEQTILSSNRKVLFKSDFPMFFYLLLNEFTLFPFHILQRIFKRNSNSLVIYCEMMKH
jgi:phospholipid N-methyltransferase